MSNVRKLQNASSSCHTQHCLHKVLNLSYFGLQCLMSDIWKLAFIAFIFQTGCTQNFAVKSGGGGCGNQNYHYTQQNRNHMCNQMIRNFSQLFAYLPRTSTNPNPRRKGSSINCRLRTMNRRVDSRFPNHGLVEPLCIITKPRKDTSKDRQIAYILFKVNVLKLQST